ncbi:prenyltransferase/squalene oxidase repeat-containing protein [Haloferula sargassicola]|uniref:Squalene cyclase C-terminal domain-containing protein n=1 Tax=Haloferula sargassicola TaxID=490096 RepID=A0ABP9UK91_9BACT
MSLHAQLSPEAQARLHAQKRNSTISSIVISLLVVVLLGLILAFILLPPLLREVPVIVSYQSNSTTEEKMETKKLTNSVQRKPSAPSSAMSKVIAANTTSPTAVPVPDIDVPEPSLDFGNGDDFGDGWGSGGDGGGGGFGSIPATMKKRCSPEDRMQRLKESGGTPQCEDAVVKGLDWLKNTQASDGSWGGKYRSADTGFAVLAFLGHCETPLSEKYGETVLKGITWLVDLGMKQNGRLNVSGETNPYPYEHAIATYALGESTTFCRQLGINIPNLDDVTQKAGQYILDHQHSSGGWDYGYRVDGDRGGDLSVSAWQIQALKACKHTGLDFKNMNKAVRGALSYVKECQVRDGGFGYRPSENNFSPSGYASLTGAGMLAYQMWGKPSVSEVRNGAGYIRKNSKFDYNGARADLYAHYYESQAMIARGGEDWKMYNSMFRDQVLGGQEADGSWKQPGRGTIDGHAAEHYGNRHYRTCLCILMLESYYRFLPATGEGH